MIFFSKNRWYDIFSDFELNVLAFCQKTIGEVVKTAFFVPIRTFFQKDIFNKIYCFIFPFGTVGDNFLALRRKFFDEVAKTAFDVPIKTLQVIFSEKNIVLIFFLHWAIFLDLMLKFSRRGCKNCILPLHRVILMRKIFWWRNPNVFHSIRDFIDKSLAVCWEIFGRFLAIAIYVFIRFFPTEKTFVWKFLIFIISDNDWKKIELRQAVFWLSELHSTCA